MGAIHKLFMLRQQPLEKFLGKCLFPRTVSHTFVQRVLEIGVTVFQTFNHFKGLVWGNDGIFQAVEGPWAYSKLLRSMPFHRRSRGQ